MANATFIVTVCAAVAAWVCMAVFAVRMLRHRRRPILWLAMNGWAFFRGDAFTPEAESDRRRFLLAFAASFVAIAAAAVAAVVAHAA